MQSDLANNPLPDKSGHDLFMDYRGVKCPMNFARITVDLMHMEIGQRLKVFIDDGEPALNMPRSLKREGQEIESISQEKNYWSLVIIKRSD